MSEKDIYTPDPILGGDKNKKSSFTFKGSDFKQRAYQEPTKPRVYVDKRTRANVQNPAVARIISFCIALSIFGTVTKAIINVSKTQREITKNMNNIPTINVDGVSGDAKRRLFLSNFADYIEAYMEENGDYPINEQGQIDGSLVYGYTKGVCQEVESSDEIKYTGRCDGDVFRDPSGIDYSLAYIDDLSSYDGEVLGKTLDDEFNGVIYMFKHANCGVMPGQIIKETKPNQMALMMDSESGISICTAVNP